jgi:feruloyl esterase
VTYQRAIIVSLGVKMIIRVFAIVLSAVPLMAATCTTEAISALAVPNMKVESTTLVPPAGGLPEYCRVSGTVTTTGEQAPDGSARFDVRLPANWNGKFLFYGVGGLAGSIPANYDSEHALPQGYAIAITDTGHQAGGTDARWALTPSGGPDQAKIADYYFRGAHSVTVAAKALVLKYYGASAIQRAYFGGCSNGGRMALQEATRYPDDYDGIIAGAPFMSVRAILHGLKMQKALTPDTYLPPALLQNVDEAVYASCDAADGVKDGLIQNPAKCSFNPETLICKNGAADSCLSKGQAETLKRYFEPVRDARGRLAVPGFAVTDLAGRGGMSAWTTGNTPPDPSDSERWKSNAPAGWLFASHITQYIVERDPKFDALSFGVSADGKIPDAALKLYDERTDAGSADNPAKLKPFIQKGKKLLLYHGYSDPALTPFKTILYYEDLAAATPGGYPSLQKNVRLFMVPGMQHCGGGPGPNQFSSLKALDEWVDKGTAPDQIIATKITNDRASDAAIRRMPLCKFPEEAQYKGSGDVNDAANWSCSGNSSLLETGPNGIESGLRGRK